MASKLIEKYIQDLTDDLRLYLLEEKIDIKHRMRITRWAIIKFKKYTIGLDSIDNHDLPDKILIKYLDKIFIDIEIKAVEIAKSIKEKERKKRRKIVTNLIKKMAYLLLCVCAVTIGVLILI